MNEVPAPGLGLHQHHHHAAWGDPTAPLMDYNNVNVLNLCLLSENEYHSCKLCINCLETQCHINNDNNLKFVTCFTHLAVAII